VSGRKMQGANVFAVQVHGDIVIEGNDRQRPFGLRLVLDMDRSAVACRAAFLEALPNVVVGDDRSLLLEELVSASVVVVIVRIDDEAHGLVSDAFEGGLNFLGERRVLVIDDDDAVVTD
jgi:hypothetical protein